MLKTDFVTANAALEKIEPIVKLSFTTGRSTNGGESRSNWSLDDYRKKDPLALKKDPELYNKLLEKEDNN